MISYYLSIVETKEDKDKVVFIYENFYSFMSYTAGQVLKHNKQDVEDSVHSAMIKLIENIDLVDLSDIHRAKNLCGIVAKNKAKDHCRLKENQTLSLDDVFYCVNEEETNPSEIIIKKDTYDVVLKAIYELDEKYRDVCILKYIHEYKEREIALLLDLSPKTVSTRIFRGKQILREVLRKEELHV